MIGSITEPGAGAISLAHREDRRSVRSRLDRPTFLRAYRRRSARPQMGARTAHRREYRRRGHEHRRPPWASRGQHPTGTHLMVAPPVPLAFSNMLRRNTSRYDPRPSSSRSPSWRKSPMFLWSGRTLPAVTLKELIDYGKLNPGKLTYASGGAGSTAHLSSGAARRPGRHQHGACGLIAAHSPRSPIS